MKRFLRGKVGVVVAAAGLVTASGAEVDFRTDINPALLYFQAYQNMPQLSDEDTKHLFDYPGAWPEQIDERAKGLLKQYDNSFKGLRRARYSKVACDWGYDLSDGPEALLPGLAPAKRLSQATRLRMMAALDANDFAAAKEDLVSAFTLARNLSRDGILISALVQIAMENILTSVVAENYHQLSAEQLSELVAAFDSAPPRGTIAQTIPTENHAFYRYLVRKVNALVAESNGDTAAFWEKFETFWNPIASDPIENKGPEPSAEEVQTAANDRTDELMKLLDEMPAYYDEMGRVMALPYAEYKVQAPVLFARIQSSPNPFIRQFFRVFTNVRPKEFAAVLRMEMVRAAAAYKSGGKAAFEAVQDPLAGGAFEFSRVQFEGVDRGFRLKSKERIRDFEEVMIFLEKPGKPFRLDGKNAGSAR
jgi:hypothetical protein